MARMQRDFTAHGFIVLNLDYPSRSYDIRNLVELIWPQIDSFVKDKNKPVSFVGHSMGGLIARAYVTAYPPQHMGRMVLLGTPNHGSEVADLLKDAKLYKRFGGAAGQELTTTWNAGAAFGPVDYDLGVIAGTRSIDPASSAIIPGADDGKVSVKSTALAGMKDRLILPVTHTFMPENASVIRQTRSFLLTGNFLHAAESR